MKLLTPLPSVMAKVSDLVDRDVISNIEVDQKTPFPLLAIPYALNQFAAGGRLVASCNIADSAIVSNGATVQTIWGILEKGVWDIEIVTHYTANYSVPGTVGFFCDLVQTGSVISERLLGLMPDFVSLVMRMKVRVTIDRDNVNFRTSLVGNGVGQSHAHVSALHLTRLL